MYCEKLNKGRKDIIANFKEFLQTDKYNDFFEDIKNKDKLFF